MTKYQVITNRIRRNNFHFRSIFFAQFTVCSHVIIFALLLFVFGTTTNNSFVVVRSGIRNFCVFQQCYALGWPMHTDTTALARTFTCMHTAHTKSDYDFLFFSSYFSFLLYFEILPITGL